MIKPVVIAGIVLILVALGFLSRRGRPESRLYAIPEDALPGYLIPLEPCEHQPGKKKLNAECGTLTVPENRDDPNSRLIALPVVRIPATRPDPAEPVFVLLGGPGASNLLFTPKDWLLEKHDPSHQQLMRERLGL